MKFDLVSNAIKRSNQGTGDNDALRSEELLEFGAWTSTINGKDINVKTKKKISDLLEMSLQEMLETTFSLVKSY